MSEKHPLFRGAVILTAAGLVSRVMGFFFRIFLSRAFGEENVGLYQLIFPVYALCLSVSTAGLQMALSRITAREHSLGRMRAAVSALAAALFVTLLISCAEVLIVQANAPFIAGVLLGEPRCEELILILSYALPFAAVHSCICGYHLGLQDAKKPAASQLVEQTVRILFTVLFFLFLSGSGSPVSIQLAAAGIVAGECAAAFFCARTLAGGKKGPYRPSAAGAAKQMKGLLSLSLPLTANRTAVTLLQSVEAASIPAGLKLYGMDTAEALSLYGVLTGMALPCILFPSAVTNSVGTMLMPAVSAAGAAGDRTALLRLIRKAVGSCLFLGLSSCLFFLLFGKHIGLLLFHSASAGRFLLTLAWICPFLYTNTALLSAVNGCRKTSASFLINMAGLSVRIASVFLAVPRFGMRGYLWGLLASQLLVSVLAFAALMSRTSRAAGAAGPEAPGSHTVPG